MEDVETPEEAIVAQADEFADTPNEETLVGKVTFTDILFT